ncbi:4'-phosphopantetheinyl transferase superfamily protein [uncultured Winogradskyella sp.]|uniref:4'-phosphopantetheinyl transferase family protein n=1 Tax=uncultured Winogradskyella sp. TaxID=395353 RepID=UPI0026190C1C|nr:4'-phosphopantetheinyl transferase superfamily protein [uncultured Winogradskyella sp.]
MVGNDIVDLNEAKKTSNWERPRFLNKLFSEEEQYQIKTSHNPFVMIWRLWSMKEASYKLYTQLHPSRFYNPKGFLCDIEGHKGVVSFRNFKCYVESKITSDYIISEARFEPQKLTSTIVSFNTTIYKVQSGLLKSELLDGFGKEYRINKTKFNIPVLTNAKNIHNISLTHHGNYGAYAIA